VLPRSTAEGWNRVRVRRAEYAPPVSAAGTETGVRGGVGAPAAPSAVVGHSPAHRKLAHGCAPFVFIW
jgi:hypothetical protein